MTGAHSENALGGGAIKPFRKPDSAGDLTPMITQDSERVSQTGSQGVD